MEEEEGACCFGRRAATHTVTVAHERPVCSILAGDIVPTHPMCAPSPNPAQQHVRRQYRGWRSFTDVPTNPAFHLSARLQCRHLTAGATSIPRMSCNVFLGPSWPFFQNRPARTPPSPPPCRCPLSIYRQVPSTPVYFSLPCTSFPAHTPLPIASSLNLTRLGLSSAPAQLSSARTRTSAACSCCGRHGTAGQAGFIHSRQLVAWVSRHPGAQYGCMHAYTQIHLQNIYHSGNWPGGLRRCLSPTSSPSSSYLISGR